MKTLSRRELLTSILCCAALPLTSLLPMEVIAKDDGKKILVVYFSMPETDNPVGMTRDEENSTVVVEGKVLGNTQYAALLIQKYLGADIARLEPVNPYPRDHDTLVDLAEEEKKLRARPALAVNPDVEPYDTIFIGYPNWWADLPMILYTFLEQSDLAGKRVIPFCTHGGSGLSRTVNTIARLQPKADVERKALAIDRDDMDEAPTAVEAWLRRLGYDVEV